MFYDKCAAQDLSILHGLTGCPIIQVKVCTSALSPGEYVVLKYSNVALQDCHQGLEAGSSARLLNLRRPNHV